MYNNGDIIMKTDDDKWIHELYQYAERNITGYKRPADYKERVKRILERRPKRSNGHETI